MKLTDLLGNITATTPDGIAAEIEANAKAAGASLLISDKENIYIPKARFDELNATKKTLEATVAEQTAEVAKLSTLTAENEATKTQLETMTNQLAAATEVGKKASILAAINAKVADKEKPLNSIAPVTDLLGFIDTSKLTVSESGEVVGLDEQLASVKASKSYLFKEDAPADPPGGATPNPMEQFFAAGTLPTGATPPGGTGNPGKPNASSLFGGAGAAPEVGSLGKILGSQVASAQKDSSESNFFGGN